MSNPSIGAIDIELVADLVSFKLGLDEAEKNVGDFGTKTSRKFKETSEQARHSIDLLSESVGVHLPRELKALISQIPGLNTALSSAFSIAAIGSVVALLGEAVTKVIEYREAVKDAAEKWQAFLTSNLADQNKQRDALAQSVIQLRAQGDQVKALQLQYQELKRDISALSPEVEKFGKAFEDALKPQAKTDTWLSYLEEVLKQTAPALANSLDNLRSHAGELTQEAKEFHKALSETANTEGTAAALKLVDDKLSTVYARLQKFPKDEGLTAFKQDLEALQKSLSTEATKRFTDEQINLNDTFKQLSEGARDLQNKLAALVGSTENDPFSQIEEKFRKVEDEFRHAAKENPEIFKAAFPYETIDQLIARFERMKRALLDTELAKGVQDSGKIIKESLESTGNEIDKILSKTATLPTLSSKPHTPTSLEKTLEGLNSTDPATNAKNTAAELQKIADATETDNQKFEEQVAIIESLKAKFPELAGQLDAYRRLIDPATQAWKAFGAEVGDTVRDAALFGRSWGDVLKTLLLDLLKVIAQLTIMKYLQSSSNSGGVGGFFSNILGGLLGAGRGHAQGGRVNPNTVYPVGENGMELFRPDVAGTVIPNSALGGGTKNQVNYIIDARGAQPGVEDRIRRALRESEDRAVVRSVSAVSDLQKRR